MVDIPPNKYDIRVSGFGFRVSGFGFRVSGFGFRVSGFGFRVSGFVGSMAIHLIVDMVLYIAKVCQPFVTYLMLSA